VRQLNIAVTDPRACPRIFRVGGGAGVTFAARADARRMPKAWHPEAWRVLSRLVGRGLNYRNHSCQLASPRVGFVVGQIPPPRQFARFLAFLQPN